MNMSWDQKLNLIKQSLNIDSAEEGIEEVSFSQERENKVRIQDLASDHNFLISERKLLRKGVQALKEYARRNSAAIWERSGYWWNNSAEILVDFHLDGYKVWYLGEEDQPWYIPTDDRYKAVPPPSFYIDDIEFKILKPSFTFWSLVAYDCHIRKYQETSSFEYIKDDWQIIRIKNIALDEVERALSALIFEFHRLRLPGFKGGLVNRFIEEREGYYFWKKLNSSKKFIFSRKHLIASPYLMEAVKAFNEAQGLSTPWAILSLFRAIEAICTQIENDRISNIRFDTSIENPFFIREARSILSSSAESRIRNLIKAIDVTKGLPSRYRFPGFQSKLSQIVNHRNSIAHGGSIASANSIYSPSILESNPEFEETKSLLNGLAEASIKWLSERA